MLRRTSGANIFVCFLNIEEVNKPLKISILHPKAFLSSSSRKLSACSQHNDFI